MEKKLQLYVTKLIEKIPDPRNAKKHYQLFIKKKKINKTIKNNYSAAKTVWKPIVDIKSILMKHPKLHIKTKRQAEKVSQVGFNS